MSWFLIFLIGLGVLLLFVEIALLPGFGAAGIPGLALVIAGIVLAWGEFGNGENRLDLRECYGCIDYPISGSGALAFPTNKAWAVIYPQYRGESYGWIPGTAPTIGQLGR